ncbi:hypothetical protein KWH75_14715 [Morganella morganii]|uniref:hypothetical protein n=1 Tax=Morganella morganii TaxID=582 RepID=UPI0021D27C39|nr:hypothetical protein [Morganella morganii]MCU6238316.1 hypothetical protein [Morganella morganii]
MSIGDWFSGIAAFAAVISAVGTVFTAYIAFKALNAWKPQRESELRDRFRLSLFDYVVKVENLPEYVDEREHASQLDELSHAKAQCDKDWAIADYKKNRRLSEYYHGLNYKHVIFMAFQIEQRELLGHCREMVARLEE